MDMRSDWWKTKEPGICWVCGGLTRSVWLDQGHQHRDCDWYPTNDDASQSRKFVRGVEVAT